MSSAKVVTALSPWLLFAVLVGRDSDHRVAIAAVVALAVAVGLAVHSAVVRRRLTSLDVAGVVTFAAFTLVAVPADGGGRIWVADHGLAVATLVLAVAMLGSAVTVPFTAQYARGEVPQQYWTSPVFRSLHVRSSAIWGAVVSLVTVVLFLL